MINYNPIRVFQHEIRKVFPGICFYLVEGPDVTEDDLTFWVNYLAYTSEKVGSTSTGTTNYRASETAKASLRGKPVKVGPTVSIFDPELQGMIGMEI